MAGWGAWGGRVNGRAVVAAALLLVGSGCSREREGNERGRASEFPGEIAGEPPASPAQMRREFVVLRELVKQHAAQGEAENEVRVAAVERHLREWLARIPDEGANEGEREVLRLARELDRRE